MAWRDQLLPGSYKKVPFFIDGHEMTGGKRIVDHLFPYRDKAFTESLGRKQRVYSMDAYVLGEDYFPARDKLLEALESDGAGTLIHPYLGSKNVEAVDVSMNETKSDGGICYFKIVFHETEAKPSADIGQDPVQKAAIVDEKIEQSLIDSFLKFNVSGLSSINLDRMIATVDLGTELLAKAGEFIPAGDFGISELSYAIKIAKRQTRDLIVQPILLARYIFDSAELLKNSMTLDDLSPKDQFGRDLLKDPNAFRDAVLGSRRRRKGFRAMIEGVDDFPIYPGVTLNKLQLQLNSRLYANLVKGSALSKLASVSMQTIYATYNEALEERDYLISEIEKLISDPEIPDETYQFFKDLIVIIIEGIPGEFTEESRLSTAEYQSSMPSLFIANDLYDSLQLEGDLIARNLVKNPAFFNVGKIEVIAGD